MPNAIKFRARTKEKEGTSCHGVIQKNFRNVPSPWLLLRRRLIPFCKMSKARSTARDTSDAPFPRLFCISCRFIYLAIISIHYNTKRSWIVTELTVTCQCQWPHSVHPVSPESSVSSLSALFLLIYSSLSCYYRDQHYPHPVVKQQTLRL